MKIPAHVFTNLLWNNFLSGLKKLTVKPHEFFLWKEE